MNKIYIISLMLMLFIISSGVYAEDNTADEVGVNDENNINIENGDYLSQSDNELVYDENNASSATFANLADEIENAVGELNLTGNYVYSDDDSLTDGISIDKTITINGNDHYIDACGQSRIFYITGSDVILKNIRFINGNATDGGAIYAAGANISITDCIFENNHADNGGAVYFNRSGAVENTVFKDNTAETYGGAMYLVNRTNVTNCIFDANDAERGAGLFLKSKVDPVPWYEKNGTEFNPEYDFNITDDEDNETYEFNETEEDFDETEIYNETDDSESSGIWDYDFVEIEPDTIIINSIFKNSRNTTFAEIFCEPQNQVLINNTQFENIKTQYGSALYCQDDTRIHIHNSQFRNLNANKTGGAIAGTSVTDTYINNCSFLNVSSSKNGGAIYNDMNSWSYASLATAVIINSEFSNCSSDFGGAVLQTGGILVILNSTFEDNSATYDGGAVYTSKTFDVKIANSTFLENRLNYTNGEGLSRGGAAYIDLADTLAVNSTSFIGNSNNAIYCYDSVILINSSYFENNTEAIHSIYTRYIDLHDNNYTSDVVIENDENSFIQIVVTGEGLRLELINNTITADELPAYYNSNDWGWVTPVKNQFFSGGCWCFSTISALETALLKSTGISYDFSEQNIQKLSLLYSKYGDLNLVEGGFTTIAVQYLLSWLGPIPEENDTFDIIGKITRVIPMPQKIHVQDAILVPARQNTTDNNAIKQAILKYGSVTTDFNSDMSEPNFNRNTSAYYYHLKDNTPSSHAVAIVGWDDNYPAENFIVSPPGNGAWIVKNSYTSDEFDHGYIYISYFDNIMGMTSEGLAFAIINTENYTKNYQTDFSGDVVIHTECENYTYKNSYRSIANDLIAGVGTYFSNEGEEYVLEVYVNGDLRLTQNGTSPFRGFHTIKLTEEIPVRTDDNFTVVVKTHSVPILNNTRVHFRQNVSFVDNGTGWHDPSLENATVVLKVYTKDLPDPLTTAISAPSLSCTYNKDEYLIATLTDIYGDPIANATVSITLNGDSKNMTTDENGQVKVILNKLAPKKYAASLTFAGDGKYAPSNATAKVVIKKAVPKFKASKKALKHTSKVKYKITLKANKKAVKKAKVILKVNRKTFTAKTSKKGVATFKITSLNKKGTFKVKLAFKGNKYYKKATKTVKIKVK